MPVKAQAKHREEEVLDRRAYSIEELKLSTDNLNRWKDAAKKLAELDQKRAQRFEG